MHPLVKLLLGASTVTVCAVGAFFILLTFMLWGNRNLLMHVDGTLTRFEAVESKAYATLSNVDKASAIWAASSKDQAQDVKHVTQNVAQLTQDARGAVSAATGAAESAQTTIATIGESAAAARPLLLASTDLVASARLDADKLGHTIDASTDAVDNVDTMLKANATHISGITANLDALTLESAGITHDFHKMSTHLEARIDAKGRWYTKIMPVTSDAAKIYTCVYLHVCY